MLDMKKSVELSQEALEVMPGPHSNLPGYELFKPIYLERGSGAHLIDVDGNDFLDYMAGLGAGILGYGNTEYLDAIKRQLDSMYFLDAARRNPLEIELAKKIIQHVPCAEKVRYLLSGTEAVQLVIRLARAYTGRNLFIRFDGHYHGWLDNVLGGSVPANLEERPFAVENPNDIFTSKGRDPLALQQSFKIPWNEIAILEQVLKKYGEEIALIIMEPINCNGGNCAPKPGYLERVRELCNQYGIVLCFDEIITGFRLSLNCAQGLTGVTPDLCTLGKGVAGGIPISIIAGKAEIMDLCTKRIVVGAGTFNGYPLGVAAALATIKILERNNGAFYKERAIIQKRLTSGLVDIAHHYEYPMLMQDVLGVLFFQFIDKEVVWNMGEWIKEADSVMQEKFRQELFDEGILILFRGRWFMSGGLTEKDVDKTLEIVDRVFKKL